MAGERENRSEIKSSGQRKPNFTQLWSVSSPVPVRLPLCLSLFPPFSLSPPPSALALSGPVITLAHDAAALRHPLTSPASCFLSPFSNYFIMKPLVLKENEFPANFECPPRCVCSLKTQCGFLSKMKTCENWEKPLSKFKGNDGTTP